MSRRGDLLGRSVVYVPLILLSAVCVIPFYVMMINATRTNAEISVAVSFFPGRNLVRNYAKLNDTINMLGALRNSVIIASLSTVLTGYFGAMAAYGFAKFRFKGRSLLFALTLSTMMIPFQLCYIGLYQAVARLHLINTFWPIIVPAMANAATVFWMRNHMTSVVDTAYMEAARIDGYSEMAIFHAIVLPLARNGLFTVSIFNFVNAWNDYIAPLIFLYSNERFPLSLAIAVVKQADFQDQGAIYAGVAMSVLPILIVYGFLSSKIISGISVGGIKG
jgi:multiple sugar transport system permease protein